MCHPIRYYLVSYATAMTLDQKIQVWVAVGTWFAGIATAAAVLVALYLANRVEKVKLKAYVGIRELFRGDGSPAEDHLVINVTNHGERRVNINSVGWAVGKGKQRRFSIQSVAGAYSKQYPLKLEYGEDASFMVSFVLVPNWEREFATRFVRDLSDKNLRTVVAQIHTSVGQTIEVKPESGLLEDLKKFR